jgi:hypothetical protein
LHDLLLPQLYSNVNHSDARRFYWLLSVNMQSDVTKVMIANIGIGTIRD